ncbi:MAG: hypothetical protein KDC07_02370 [Chitinophagaceae bacterium]|nr:hypothetical protein [Chitinophagaceae bacterium]
MKQILLTLTFGLLLVPAIYAQDVYSSSGKPLNRSETNVKSDKLIDPQRIIFGGWGIFGIASGVTNIGATPILGYRITDYFSAGVGFGYQYLHIKNYFSVIVDPVTAREELHPLNAHFYSPSVWMRYVIWNNIFAHVEYEHNISSYKEYTNDYTKSPPPVITKNTTLTVPSLLAGGGIRQPISDRASMVFMALYDVLQDQNSPYRNTVAFRLGINIGF